MQPSGLRHSRKSRVLAGILQVVEMSRTVDVGTQTSTAVPGTSGRVPLLQDYPTNTVANDHVLHLNVGGVCISIGRATLTQVRIGGLPVTEEVVAA